MHRAISEDLVKKEQNRNGWIHIKGRRIYRCLLDWSLDCLTHGHSVPGSDGSIPNSHSPRQTSKEKENAKGNGG